MALNIAPWSAVETARATLDDKRLSVRVFFDTVEFAKAQLAEAQRTLTGPALQPFIDALSSSQNLLTSARSQEVQARQDLAGAIATWAPKTLSADDDMKRLPATAPFVMLPIRIETRFGTDPTNNNAAVLRLRVYPDEIFLNTHETALTRDEIDAAKNYFTEADTIQEQPEHWRELIRGMSPERAAWVLRTMQPHDINATGTLSMTFVDPAPGYPPNATHPGMRFPDPRKRPATWSKAGEAVLPDRWIIVLRNGTVTRTIVGNPIPEPLAMTADPSVTPEEMVFVPGTNNGLTIDPKILWTVDYTEAERVGMAKTITLQGNEATAGFDRVVVYGVKTSLRQEATSTLVEKLIDAHHYTRGLSVVTQGSPTNNTEDQPSAVSHEEDPDETFHVERDPQPSFPDHHDYRLTSTDDGDYLARAFGVPNGTFLNIRGAHSVPLFATGTTDEFAGREQRRAEAMMNLLWELLVGHFGREMLDWTSDQQLQIRDWVTNFVRARGPVPAIRIGTVPYGILPAVSLLRWQARRLNASEGLEQQRQALEGTMLAPLRNLRERWKAAAIGQTPRIKLNSTDPSGDLMKALAVYPSAREARVRNVTGQLYAFHMVNFLGFEFTSVANRVAQAVAGAVSRIGVPQWLSRPIATLVFDNAASRFSGALVAGPTKMSETDPLSGSENYLHVLQSANIQQLFGANSQSVPVTGTNTTLLYRMLLHAMILEATQAALDIITAQHVVVNVTINTNFHGFRARQLISVKNLPGNPNAPVPTPRELLLTTVPSEVVTAFPGTPTNQRFGDFILTQKSGTIGTVLSSLARLENLPTLELERLFTESMDVASHRLDAWLTGFATRRLNLMRARQASDHVFPTGDFLGGWGYVENLRPAVRQTDPTTGLPIQAGNGGFIHAPSMAHAAAAGVLRNGHLTHKDEDGKKCAVDLSSARVRGAQLILDELRAGQNLGAVLGYRFERRLQERAQLLIQQGFPARAGAIEAYRIALRDRFPLVVNKQAPNVAGTVDGVAAARNVVDGLVLRNAFIAVPPGINPINELGADNGGVVVQELNALNDMVDGVADLVTSESIMSFVRGNTGRAAGTLDALARGGRPPEAEMVRSVTRGPSLTFPVALVLNGDTPQGDWPALVSSPSTSTYRSEVDATLDKWAGGLIGDPSKVVCQVTVQKKNAPDEVRSVKLSDLSYRETRTAGGTPAPLKLRPMDVVALARSTALANQGSLLDRWITSAAITPAGQQAGEQVGSIDYTKVGGNATFPEAMEIALSIGQLLGGARPLRPEDLTIPGELVDLRTDLAQAASDGATALQTEANAASGFVDNAIVVLQSAGDADARRVALENASAFVASAYPSSVMTDDQLKVMVDATVADLQRRQADLLDNPALPAGSGPGAIVERSLARLRIVFGTETIAMLQFTLPGGAELSRSFTELAATFTTDEKDEPARFIQGATEVREGLWRWRRLMLYIRALGRKPALRLDVGQLPSVPGRRWIGLPFNKDGEQDPPPANGFSPLLYSYGSNVPDTGTPWAGLLLDTWSEVVPNDSEETGIAFHYDSPGAEAPQVILVVPPSSVGVQCPNDSDPNVDGWQALDMIATLNETIDLAKIRTVDAQMVDFGQLFPTIYMTENTRGFMPTTGWLGSLFSRLAIPRT